MGCVAALGVSAAPWHGLHENFWTQVGVLHTCTCTARVTFWVDEKNARTLAGSMLRLRLPEQAERMCLSMLATNSSSSHAA